MPMERSAGFRAVFRCVTNLWVSCLLRIGSFIVISLIGKGELSDWFFKAVRDHVPLNFVCKGQKGIV